MEPLFATILVLVVTNRNIVLAADSRKVVLSPDGVEEKEIMNKVYQTNDYYYAFSGLDSSGVGGFSIQTILDNILRAYEDFELSIQQIVAILPKAIKDFFSGLKEGHSALFAQFQKYCDSGGEIIIIKRVDRLPTVYLLDYRIVNESSIKVVMNTWKTNISAIKGPNECFWRAIGNTAFLNGYQISEEEMATQSVEKATQIIKEGIRRYPDFVGSPIKVLIMDESGDQWLEDHLPENGYSF
jgi:hypothetical protein